MTKKYWSVQCQQIVSLFVDFFLSVKIISFSETFYWFPSLKIVLLVACFEYTLQGYDLTKQKSPGYSRAVSRIRTSSMLTHYSVDKQVPFQCQSTAASEKFTRRRPLDAPSFSGRNLSYFSKHRQLRWDRLQTNVTYDVASAVEVINDLGLDTLTFLAVTVFIVPSFKLIKASPVRIS